MPDLIPIVEHCKAKKLKLLYFYSDKNSQAYEIFDFNLQTHLSKFLNNHFQHLSEAQIKSLLNTKVVRIENTINVKQHGNKVKVVDAIKIYSFVL